MSEPRQYELIYVIAPDVDDAGVADLHARVEGIVTAGGGQIDKTDNWGRRRLAYEIDRHREGTYVLELFTGSGAIVSELDRRLKVADNVLRYLIVRVDEDLRKAERARGRRQAKRQHRQSTRGESAAAPAAEASEASAPVEAAAPTEASGDQPGPAAEVSE
jgi:small subunit ribosomal protein S6